ncbi:MAG: hypothetical protein HY925_16150 [Elusimicrobia bacterium]|nr:hypothetical protein [Elusimicrobiota bacterium]
MRKFILVAAVLAACAPRTAELRRTVADSGRGRVSVEAPELQALGPELKALGFQVVAEGAESVVRARVAELGRRAVSYPDEYEERVRTFPNAAGRQEALIERVLIRPARIEYVAVFRGEAELVDAKTGALLARASTWKESPGTAEDAARLGAEDLARRLAAELAKPRG